MATSRRVTPLILLAVGLCSAGVVNAKEIGLQAVIDGVQSGSGSESVAWADVLYDPDTMTVSWDIGPVTPFFDTAVRFAHFHGPALPGQNAGVQVWICDNTGNGPVGTGACGGEDEDFSVDAAVITDDQADDLLAGLYYINIHTDDFPGGEIRGQVNAVPAPAGMALLGAGLLALGGLRRRTVS